MSPSMGCDRCWRRHRGHAGGHLCRRTRRAGLGDRCARRCRRHLHLVDRSTQRRRNELQAQKGISDTPDAHYDDIMRISKNTADPRWSRLAVDNAADTFDWLQDNGLRRFGRAPRFGQGPRTLQRAALLLGVDGG